MTSIFLPRFLAALCVAAVLPAFHVLVAAAGADDAGPVGRVLGLFYETASGRVEVPFALDDVRAPAGEKARTLESADGRAVTVTLAPGGNDAAAVDVHLSAAPAEGIVRWGLAIEATADEYFTGVMERVVDGPQQASWAPGITAAMDLRGQKVDMLVKPTTSVYAPFFLSSRGYGVFVETRWPGFYDFCVDDPQKVRITFEGPSLALTLFRGTPAEIVQAHALRAGPPFLPPKWMFLPWRWRDEHKQHEAYYDGTPVTAPFNADVLEDMLMMRAYGVPCGVYWIDRPWGPGALGYDDFEIDAQRLPNFEAMVKWLNSQGAQLVLWIGPFYQGKMAEEALAKGWNLAGQIRPSSGNNYPMVDLTNPEARAYWQDGVAKLLRLGVAGFKLDRGEENIPEDGPFQTFDGRTIRENRNNYVVLYLKSTYDVAKKHRGDDFVLMPRGAYTGSSPYGVFWGGDIGGNYEGLRASIIAVQRSAVMGYPNWGSDTGGYGRSNLEQEMYVRWLAFSCFTPIMEVGPTRNVGFWNLPREPAYDAMAIAAWRLYARLHQRLADYGYTHALEATKTGMPIVRPLFLVEPQAPAAWTNWWTYLYGRDVVVSPIWEKGKREQEVYLPGGSRWVDAWNPATTHDGGQTITVAVEMYQIPIFVRQGARLDLGDLNKEWTESLAIAENKPDLKPLDAEVRAWFEEHPPKP